MITTCVFVGAARRGTVVAALAMGAAVVGGCAPAATFRIHQPRLIGRQRDMTLTSVNAAYGRDEQAAAWHVLLRFPLPGASSGRMGYLIYLHVPEPPVRKGGVSYALSETAGARGFFFQRAGEGRGREPIISGFVHLERRGPDQCALRLVANGDVGTEIQGTALLLRDDLNVRDYLDEHHPGDVADLLKPTATSRAAPR